MNNVRTTGYRVYLHFSIVANKTAGIILASEKYNTESSHYEISMTDILNAYRLVKMTMLRNSITNIANFALQNSTTFLILLDSSVNM